MRSLSTDPSYTTTTATTKSNCSTSSHRPPSRSSSVLSALSSNVKGLAPSKRTISPKSIATTAPAELRPTRRVGVSTTPSPRICTVSASTKSAARQPLRTRDQNAAPSPAVPSLRLTQHSIKTPSATTKMPFDRASTTSNASRAPLAPVLARGQGRAPLTPKVAASRAPTQHQTVTLATPLPRRIQRAESNHGSQQGGPKEREREEITTPNSAFLSHNITPRSGSRQSRVDSANSTPNGTPQPDRHETWDARSGGAPGSAHDPRRPSFVSNASECGPGPRVNVESKFFYASEAPRQPVQPAQAPRPFVAPQPKQSSFFYASGHSVQDSQQHVVQPTLAAVANHSAPQDPLMSKFVYADGTADAHAPNKPAFTLAAASVISSSSKVASNRPTLAAASSGFYGQRPVSPVKMPSYSSNHSGNSSTVGPLRSPGLPPTSTAPDLRRISGESMPRRPGGHSRTGSVTSGLTMADPPSVARLMSSHGSYPSSEASSPSNPSNTGFTLFASNPATSGFASLLQAAEDFAEEDDEDHADEGEDGDEAEGDVSLGEGLHSPDKATSQEYQLNELVVNARRERKVQDLQITNASLEAINRTLERQLRKQTAEIRRYRRLSRSGRISMNSAGERDRIASNSSIEGGGLARAGLDLDDLSEEDSEFDDEEHDEEDFSDSDLDSGQLSPNAMAVRDVRHRRRDEERLQLDLSKHQELLIDSQKMNQSLKRCLGWTEELIKEGKRALEYKVRVSEVTLGGRVLNPEDMEENLDETETFEDDTSPTITLGVTGGSTLANQETWDKPLDGDGELEIPADGR